MRVFIGFKVPANEKLKKKLEELEPVYYVKTVESKNLHVNLKFLGDVKEKDITKIKKAIDELKGKFEIKLKGISAFPDMDFIRVIKVDIISDKLIELIKEIENKLKTPIIPCSKNV